MSLPSLGSSSRPFPLPTISEDTLHYALHLPYQLEPAATATLITEYVSSLLPELWLWNKDAWELKVVPESSGRMSKGQGGKLEGTMRVGDAVDDEWLVVWLLREVSKKWSEVVISIRDSDGEFLLIEAANELPNWVSPENAENRLWLSNGHLHLLPLHVRSSGTSVRYIPDHEEDERQYDPESWVSEEDALRAVRTGKYLSGKEMEAAVWDRIAHYPAKLSEHLHRTNAYLPLPIARALSVHPHLIQKAVEGFYVRDPAQLRSAAKMSHFPPTPSILASVTMTRAAYAQLQGQVFHPPRVFGPEWTVRAEEGKETEKRWRDLGVKIATGFEIMYKEGGRRGRSGPIGIEDDVRKEQGYQVYIDNLKKAGFFGRELEGSEKWQEAEKRAMRGWKEVRADDTKEHRPSFAYLVDSALSATSSVDPHTLTVNPNQPEDSDSWLEVSPDELDGMMMRASGQTATTANGESTAKDAEKAQAEPGDEHGKALADLAKKVETFVGGQGDLQGARFADELSDEEDDDDDEVDEDADDHWQNLTPAQKQERMQNLVAPLEDGEWGSRAKGEEDDVVMIGSTSKITNAKSAPIIAEAQPSVRAPLFAKQEFDGVVEESDSEDEDESALPLAGTHGRQIAEMRWADTAPQIEEIEDEDMLDNKRDKSVRWDEGIDEAMHRKVWADQQRELGEDRPVVVNEAEAEDDDVDMGEEQEAFLRFAREALGVDEDMWEGIVKNREDRGAFVPRLSKQNASMDKNGEEKSSAGTNGDPTTPPPPQHRQDGQPNMDLDSFDKVMAAMEAELARAKGPAIDFAPQNATSKAKQQISPVPSPKKTSISTKLPSASSSGPLPALPTEADLDAMSADDLLAMDRELRAALKGAGIEGDDDDDDDLDPDVDPEEARGLQGEDKREYRMMRNLLESFRSQAGESGAVGNLFGRLSGK